MTSKVTKRVVQDAEEKVNGLAVELELIKKKVQAAEADLARLTDLEKSKPKLQKIMEDFARGRVNKEKVDDARAEEEKMNQKIRTANELLDATKSALMEVTQEHAQARENLHIFQRFFWKDVADDLCVDLRVKSGEAILKILAANLLAGNNFLNGGGVTGAGDLLTRVFFPEGMSIDVLIPHRRQ